MNRVIKWTVLIVLFGLIPLAGIAWRIADLNQQGELLGRLWPLAVLFPLGVYAIVLSRRKR